VDVEEETMRGVVIEDAAARDDRRRRADIENAREKP